MAPKTKLPVELNPIFWETKGNIQMWKIAQKLEVTEMTLIRWLRSSIDEKKTQQILQAIDEVKLEQVK